MVAGWLSKPVGSVIKGSDIGGRSRRRWELVAVAAVTGLLVVGGFVVTFALLVLF